MIEKPQFIWYPWRDPLARDLDKKEQAAWMEQFKDLDIVIEDDDEDMDDPGFDDFIDTKIKGIATQVGVIPYTENTNPYTLFDFFTCHTNVTITNKLLDIIEKTKGVEYLSVYSRYRFRVCIGKIFTLDKNNHQPTTKFVLKEIQDNVIAHVEKYNARVKQLRAQLGYNK